MTFAPIVGRRNRYNTGVMNLPSSTWGKCLRATLLVVLLAAQGMAAAHEYTHWNHPAQELCATCSLSSGLDAPMVAQAPCLDAPKVAPFREDAFAFQLHHDAPSAFFQRAPPVHQ